MSDYAFLREENRRRPLVVRVSSDDEGLLVAYPDGRSEQIAWWRLFRVPGDDAHRFRRIEARDWELTVSSTIDRQHFQRVTHRRLSALFGRLQRLYSLKVIAGAVVLVLTFASHIPAAWAAKFIPSGAEERVVAGVLGKHGSKHCSRAGGEEALRKLSVTLDPEIGGKANVVALDYDGFIVTSAPPNTIVVHRTVLAELHVYALAALLAHELSHLRHGDPHVAVVRQNGVVGSLGALLQGAERDDLRLAFSAAEEARADREAVEMMMAARLPLKPTAELFEQLRLEEASHSYYALALRRFHFGLPKRSLHWQAAAARQRQTRDLLSQEEQDDVFNFCWPGQILPSQLKGGKVEASPVAPRAPGNVEFGLGVIGPARNQIFY